MIVIYRTLNRQNGIYMRLKEHKNDIKKHSNSHSVVNQHRVNNNHDFNWSTPHILHTEKHTQKREIAKMFFIKKLANNINLQKETENLNTIYNNLITLS